MLKRLALPFIAVLAVATAAFAENRHPYVAGSFYPSDPRELGEMVDRFLSQADPSVEAPEKIAVMILPHAGYVYSGQTAAYGYKLLARQDLDTVVLLGPYHKAYFEGASVWTAGSWQTPLGEVPVDTATAEAILKENKVFGFTTDAHLAEHSLEVQLPFIQKTLPRAKIIPILVNDPSPASARRLAKAITKHLEGKKAVVIASTDMSHYHPESRAREIDADTLKTLKANDPMALFKKIVSKENELCGNAAVMTALEVAKILGETDVKVLKYTTSAEAARDTSRVVGYGSLVISRREARNFSSSASKAAVRDGELDPAQQSELLKIARGTLEVYFAEGRSPEFEVSDPALKEPRAVFVTLKKNGVLRGCVGSILPQEPLASAVRSMALHSALHDSRFAPVTAEEFGGLTIEISVLSLPRRVASAEQVELRTHGVIVKKGSRSGVFLPQVAEEGEWTREEFLSELCVQKAGLPADCWKDKAVELSVFTAQDFSEAASVPTAPAR